MLTFVTALERGRQGGLFARGLSAVWAQAAARTLVRRLVLPPAVNVVAIGGATLGGSGKTPLAIACAAELAACGARVALVGHAYRARPGHARIVATGRAGGRADTVSEVGDEAILAARALEGAGVPVVVAPRRSEAIALAARESDVLVLDGVAQTAPARASLALLAVDAKSPWGAAALPPQGDLRAPLDVLQRACDAVVAVGGETQVATKPPSWWSAGAVSGGVRIGGALYPWEDLPSARVGLLCVLARADRLLLWLSERGVTVGSLVRARDHGPVSRGFLARAARAGREARIDLWLATPKCAIHLEEKGFRERLGAPVGVIDHRLTPCAGLRERLRGLTCYRGAP